MMTSEFEITEYGSLEKYNGSDDVISIPDGVRFIEQGAIEISPHKMILPESMQDSGLSISSFQDGGVNLMDDNGYYIADDLLFYYDGVDKHLTIPDGVKRLSCTSLSLNSSVESVVLPKSVERISHFFEYWENLRSVEMPGIVEIGLKSFHGCTSLEEIELPSCARYIKQSAFEGCTNLWKADLNEELELIDDFAFSSCYKLHDINIPESIQKIGIDAFALCDKLTAKTLVIPERLLDENQDYYSKIGVPDENGCIIVDGVLERFTLKKENATVTEGVTTVRKDAFLYRGIDNRPKRVHLPVSIRAIEEYALNDVEVDIDPAAFKTTEKLPKELSRGLSNDPLILAYALIFQSGKRWIEAVEACVDHVESNEVAKMIIKVLREHSESSKDTVAGRVVSFFAAHRNTIDSSLKDDLYAMLQSNANKWKKALASFENEFGKVGDVSDAKLIDNINNQEIPAGSSEKGKVLEEYVNEHYGDKQIYPESIAAIKEGIHYSDNVEALCSTQALILLVNEYVDEFYQVSHEVKGTMSIRRDIDDGKALYTSEIADTIAKDLDSGELNAMLKKLSSGRDYRKFLIAYARYANEDEIKEYCIEINKKKRGNSKDKYRASNMMSALYISDTAAAFEFIEKNGDIEKYSNMRGMTPDECRNVSLVPDFGMDERGIRIIESDNGIYSTFVDNKLILELVDSEGKHENNMPKKAGDKAQSEYATFKKEVDSFIKSRKADIMKLYLRSEAVDHDIWMRSYATHPILKEIGKAVIWRDKNGTTFMIDDDDMKTVDGTTCVPVGEIKPAHVLDMATDEIKKWQEYLYRQEKSLIIDQVWEPIVTYDSKKLKNRYSGLEITNKERSQLRSILKKKGIDVRADANEGEYDYRQGTYVFSETNKMNFGSSMVITYHIDENTKNITFGSDLKLKQNASKYEVNTILLEMDRIAVKSNILKDEPGNINKSVLDGFTAAQIVDFIDYATDNKSVNCNAVLQDYKNSKYPEYNSFSEFVLD